MYGVLMYHISFFATAQGPPRRLCERRRGLCSQSAPGDVRRTKLIRVLPVSGSVDRCCVPVFEPAGWFAWRTPV